jgi:hypothetical protein
MSVDVFRAVLGWCATITTACCSCGSWSSGWPTTGSIVSTASGSPCRWSNSTRSGLEFSCSISSRMWHSLSLGGG